MPLRSDIHMKVYMSHPRHLGKIYRGKRTEQGTEVTVETNGEVRPLEPRLDLWSHSPTSFDWGYGGSGPAQLALAILADCISDDVAIARPQAFKWEVIAGLAREEWCLAGTEVVEALERIREAS
jgi:hypothetical protein